MDILHYFLVNLASIPEAWGRWGSEDMKMDPQCLRKGIIKLLLNKLYAGARDEQISIWLKLSNPEDDLEIY